MSQAAELRFSAGPLKKLRFDFLAVVLIHLWLACALLRPEVLQRSFTLAFYPDPGNLLAGLRACR